MPPGPVVTAVVGATVPLTAAKAATEVCFGPQEVTTIARPRRRCRWRCCRRPSAGCELLDRGYRLKNGRAITGNMAGVGVERLRLVPGQEEAAHLNRLVTWQSIKIQAGREAAAPEPVAAVDAVAAEEDLRCRTAGQNAEVEGVGAGCHQGRRRCPSSPSRARYSARGRRSCGFSDDSFREHAAFLAPCIRGVILTTRVRRGARETGLRRHHRTSRRPTRPAAGSGFGRDWDRFGW